MRRDSGITCSVTKHLCFTENIYTIYNYYVTLSKTTPAECMCMRLDLLIIVTHINYAENVPCSTSNNTIRLGQSSIDTFGRLEVCSGNKWGTVCGSGANLETIARVACRELNHAANNGIDNYLEYCNHCTIDAGWVIVESYFINYRPPLIPITRTNMVCTGFETAISECLFDGVTGNPDCDHPDDIFILCHCKYLIRILFSGGGELLPQNLSSPPPQSSYAIIMCAAERGPNILDVVTDHN